LPTIEYIPPDNPSGRNMQNHRNRVYGIAHLRHVALVWIFVPKKERCLLLPQVYDIEGRPYEYYREIARDAWRNSPQRLEVEGALRSVERDPTVGPSSTVPSTTIFATHSAAPSTTVTATPSAAPSVAPSAVSPARGVVAQTAASLTEAEAARGQTQPGVETPFPLPEAEPQPVVHSAQKVPNPVNRGRVVVTLEDESDDEEDAEASSHGQQPIVSTPTKRPTEGPTSRPEKRAKRRSPTIPTSTRTGSSSQSSSPASYAASHMSSPLASSQGSGYSTDATSVDGSPQSQKLPQTPNPQKDTDVVMFDQDFKVEDFLTPEEIRDRYVCYVSERIRWRLTLTVLPRSMKQQHGRD